MIVFNATEHTYTNIHTGEVYPSVTQTISQFKHPFDEDGISRMVAARRGVPQAQVLAEWKATKDYACEYGTKVHASVEAFLKGTDYDPVHEPIITAFKQAFPKKVKDGVLSEHLVYDHIYKIAGTADIISPEGKYFDVFDIKTNDAIKTFSPYHNYLKAPVDHLSECELNVYALQLSIYAIFYQRMTGRIPRSLTIFHIDKETFALTKYPLPYMKLEALSILSHANSRGSSTRK